jgi:hypothetical protein
VGAAAVVIPRCAHWHRVPAPLRRIGGHGGADAEMHIQDIVLPVVGGGEGGLAQAPWEGAACGYSGRTC